jgi:hypothetical protein
MEPRRRSVMGRTTLVRRTTAFRPAIVGRSTLAIRLPRDDGGASTARQEAQL